MILQVGLPLTSRPPFDPERVFATFAQSFRETVSGSNDVRIYVGIDDGDPYYDAIEPEKRHAPHVAWDRLRSVTGATVIPVLMEGMGGRICAIWEHLAMRGHADSCDAFLFAGDDLQLITPGWDVKLCEPLHERGYGIEAFYDRAFPDFPTFPIFHRSHIDLFGRVFPPEFANASQYGDPFLFDLYKDIGAANLHRDAHCHNTIGGSGVARYDKVQPEAYRVHEWETKVRTKWNKTIV